MTLEVWTKCRNLEQKAFQALCQDVQDVLSAHSNDLDVLTLEGVWVKRCGKVPSAGGIYRLSSTLKPSSCVDVKVNLAKLSRTDYVWQVTTPGTVTMALGSVHGLSNFRGITYDNNRYFALAPYSPCNGTPVSVRFETLET